MPPLSPILQCSSELPPTATPIATTPSQHLPQSFFARPAQQDAPELIGCWLGDKHPSFLTQTPTLEGCSKRYERFCQKYRHHSKGAPKCHWGSRMLRRLVETRRSRRSKSTRISPGQTHLPFSFDFRLSQILDDWHQIAVRFRRANGIRDGDKERSIR
jgi:hypothetical protein